MPRQLCILEAGHAGELPNDFLNARVDNAIPRVFEDRLDDALGHFLFYAVLEIHGTKAGRAES